MPKFVKAISGPSNSVIYIDENGKRFLARDGTRNLRNNNPGNLVPGKISRNNSQIGVAGRFAVFPDIETGRRALVDSLKSTYGQKPLSEMIKSYAPPAENNTARYLKSLQKATGVIDQRKILEFTQTQFDSLVLEISTMEGGEHPVISEFRNGKKEILRVRKDKKGTITDYDVHGIGWLKKSEAIAYTRAGEIDAVISTSSSGRPYLKTRPDITIVNNLDNK